MRQLLQPAVTSSLCLHVHGKVKVVTYYPWPQALHRDQKQARVFLGALIHGILPGVHTNISIMTKRQKWMALEWVIAHIRRKWFNRSTSKHVNLILVTKNSALPHEFLHDMVLDPRQLRFQCYIVVPSGTAALQQLQAWKTTTDTMICSMLTRISRQPSNKTHLKRSRATHYWLLSATHCVQQGRSPSNAPPKHKPVLPCSKGFCGESQEKLPCCFTRLSTHLQWHTKDRLQEWSSLWEDPITTTPEPGGNTSCCQQSPGQSRQSLMQTHCWLYQEPSFNPPKKCNRSPGSQCSACYRTISARDERLQCPHPILPHARPPLPLQSRERTAQAGEVWISWGEQWEGKIQTEFSPYARHNHHCLEHQRITQQKENNPNQSIFCPPHTKP